MDQEPGTEAEIKKFAQSFNAEFPMFSKIDVNGPDTHEVYRYLRCNSSLMNKDLNEPEVIPWSWSKFLVDEDLRNLHQSKQLRSLTLGSSLLHF